MKAKTQAVTGVTSSFRPKSNGIHLSDLVDMNRPKRVYENVCLLVGEMSPDFRFDFLDHVFRDILDLFSGEYPGFRSCNTHYHDLKHTTDALMAMTRLIHGASCTGVRFDPRHVESALISTLMHDTGYIQPEDDLEGTGAKYTLDHISRSVTFMQNYLSGKNVSEAYQTNCMDMMNCTGLRIRIDEIRFSARQIEMLGKMLGTADLAGQLADDDYIPKLPYLYNEFVEAGMAFYKDEEDFLIKTIDFFNMTQNRFEKDLCGVNRYFRPHFKDRFGIDKDLYMEGMRENVDCLRHIFKI